MVTLARRAQHIPFAPVVAVVFGIVAAVLMAAVPVWLFERAVVASGLPNLIQAAAPPLGLVARLLAVIAAFVGAGLLVRILLIPVGRMIDGNARARTPWRDAGYDATADQSVVNPLPPRRPIFAPDELGAPLMSDEAIAAVQPAAETDFEDDAELAAPIEPEMLQPAISAPTDSDNSIMALIRRLENGLARRAPNDSGPDGSGQSVMPLSSSCMVSEKAEAAMPSRDDDETLRQALSTLRQMAVR